MWIDRSRGASTVFGSLETPQSFSSVQTVTEVLAAASVVKYAVLLAVQLIAIRKCPEWHKRKVIWYLVGNSFFSSVHSAWILTLLSADMSFDTCKYTGIWGGTLFVFSNFFVYHILLWRAQATLIDAPLMKSLMKVGKLAAMSSPGLGLIFPLFVHARQYFAEGVCIPALGSWTCWAMLVTDFSILSVFLYLFIEPVKRHIKTFDAVNHETGNKVFETETFKRMARKNLLWSSLTLVSSFLFLLMIAVENTFLDSVESPGNAWLRVSQFTVGLFNQSLNSMAMMVITKRIWQQALQGNPAKVGASRQTKLTVTFGTYNSPRRTST